MADSQNSQKEQSKSQNDDVHVHDNIYSDWASVVRKGHAQDEHPSEESDGKANLSPQQATIERGVGILPGQVERTLETQDAHAGKKKEAGQKTQEEAKQASQKEVKLPTKDVGSEKPSKSAEDDNKEEQIMQVPTKQIEKNQAEKVQSAPQLEKKTQARPDEKNISEKPVTRKPEEKPVANKTEEKKEATKPEEMQEERKVSNTISQKPAAQTQPAAKQADALTKSDAEQEPKSGEAHPHINWEPVAEAVEQAFLDEGEDSEPSVSTPPFGAQGEHDPYGEMTDYDKPDVEEMGGTTPPHACPSCSASIGDEDTICQSCQQPLPGIQPSDTFCSACQTISDSDEGGERGCPECARVAPQYCDQCSGEYEMPNLEGDEGTVSTRQNDEYNNASLRQNSLTSRSNRSATIQAPQEFYDPTGQDVIIRIGHQPRPWSGEESESGEGFWYKVAQELIKERAQQEGPAPARQSRQSILAPRRSRPANFTKGQPAQEQAHNQQSSNQSQQFSNRDQQQSREQPHQEQFAKREQQPARDQQTGRNDQSQARQLQGGRSGQADQQSRQATENRTGQENQRADIRRPLGQENLRRESWGQGQQQTGQRDQPNARQTTQGQPGQQQAAHLGNPLLDVQHFFGAVLWWVVCLAVAIHHICTHIPSFWSNTLSHARHCCGKVSDLAKESAEKLKAVGKPSEWHLPGHFGEHARAAPVAAQ